MRCNHRWEAQLLSSHTAIELIRPGTWRKKKLKHGNGAKLQWSYYYWSIMVDSRMGLGPLLLVSLLQMWSWKKTNFLLLLLYSCSLNCFAITPTILGLNRRLNSYCKSGKTQSICFHFLNTRNKIVFICHLKVCLDNQFSCLFDIIVLFYALFHCCNSRVEEK